MGNDTLSRREVLQAVAGAGALGTGTGATAGLLTDEESVGGVSVTAGRLDLETCWSDGDCGDPLSIAVGPDAGTTGSATVEYRLPADSNSAYLHVRTTCPPDACGLARRLDVTVTDGPCGRAGRTLERGSLCEVLASLHDGTALADGRPVEPGETRCLELSWHLDGTLERDDTVADVGVEFHAVQARNVEDGAAITPWDGATCEVDCSAGPDCGEDATGREISWVGFCADQGATLTDDDLAFDVDGDTLVVERAPNALATILLKHGTTLDVFRSSSPGTYRTGAGDAAFEQRGPSFPGTETDPPRSNPTPCPGRDGVKYDGDFDSPTDGGDGDA